MTDLTDPAATATPAFKPGDRVECVNDLASSMFLTAGAIDTVIEVQLGGELLLLENSRVPWLACRFRLADPVSEPRDAPATADTAIVAQACGPERVGSEVGANSLRVAALVLRELPAALMGRVLQECDFVRDRGEVESIVAAIADALDGEPPAPRPRPVCQALRPGCDFPDCPCGAP